MQEKHGASSWDFGRNVVFNICMPRFLQASAWVYVLCFFFLKKKNILHLKKLKFYIFFFKEKRAACKWLWSYDEADLCLARLVTVVKRGEKSLSSNGQRACGQLS